MVSITGSVSFMIQALLQKYVKLRQGQQMPKTYDNIKDFLCRADTGFRFEH